MENKKLKIRDSIIKMLNENKEPFFYLAPDIVGSINNANLNAKNNSFRIDFDTKDGRSLSLTVPFKTFSSWSNDNRYSDARNFVVTFIKQSSPLEDNDERLDEIIDEFGNIMGDDDEPNNATNSMIGKSKFDSERAIKQTVPKSKRYYGDLGLGIITW